MASISISMPWPNDTVSRSFVVTGNAYLDSSTGCTINVTLKDSGNNVLGSASLGYSSSAGTLIPWNVNFTVGADYYDCTITAELLVSGSNPITDGVGGINIVNNGGGGMLFP